MTGTSTPDFFTPSTSPRPSSPHTTPTTPHPVLKAAALAVNSAIYAGSQIGAAGAYVGAKVTSALVSGAKKMGSAAISGATAQVHEDQIKERLTNVLLEQPPEALTQLKASLDRLLTENVPLEEVLDPIRNALASIQWMDLLPDLNDSGLSLIDRANQNLAATPIDQTTLRPLLEEINTIATEALKRHQGSLIQSMAFLQQTLLSEQNGAIGQALDILKQKFLDGGKTFFSSLLKLFNEVQSNACLFAFYRDGEKDQIAEICALLKKKIQALATGDTSPVTLTDDEKQAVLASLHLTKSKIEDLSREQIRNLAGLLEKDLLLNRTTLSLKDKDILIKFQMLLALKIGTPTPLAFGKTESVLLQEGFSVIGRALIVKCSRSAEDLIKLIQNAESSSENRQAIALLRQRASASLKIEDALKKQSVEEPLIQLAIQSLERNLTPQRKKEVQRIGKILLERLNANEDALSARLNETQRNSLTEASRMLKGPFKSPEISAAVDILTTHALTPESAVECSQIQEKVLKIDEELNTLTQFEQAQTNARALSSLLQINRLMTNGQMTDLESKLSDQSQGIIAEAIDLLTYKLLAPEGPLERLKQEIVDEGGIFDQAIHVLDSRLNDPEKGLLVKAAAFLEHKITDENTGILAQAIELLQRKLNEENGIFATLDIKLNDAEHGLLAKAVSTLEEKFIGKDGLLERLNQAINTSALPIFTEAKEAILKLQQGVEKNYNKLKLIELAGNLKRILNTLEAQKGLIFKKSPLRENDLDKLQALQAQMDRFAGLDLPSSAALDPLFKEALSVLKYHHTSQNGLVDRTAERFTENITQGLTENGGLLDQVNDKLNASAHPLLKQAADHLAALQEAVISNTAKVKIIGLAQKAHSALDQIYLEEENVFVRSIVRQGEPDILANLKAILSPFTVLPTPPDLPTKEAILGALSPSLKIVEQHIEEQSGMINQTATNIKKAFHEALEPVFERIEKLPGKMLGHLTGNTSTEAPLASSAVEPTSIETGTPGDGSGQISIGGFLSQASGYIAKVLQDGFKAGVQGISKQSVAGIASAILYALNDALAGTEGKEEFAIENARIQELIASVNAAKESGSWSDLQNSIKSNLRFLNSLKIYVNGFRIPKLGTLGETPENPESTFINNISSLRDALENRTVEEESDWKSKALDAKDLFVKNTTNLVALKLIYESVCGLKPPNDQFYFKLICEANSAEDSEKALKAAFFQEIAKAKVSWIRYHISIPIYLFISSRILKHFIQKLANSYFLEIFEYIDSRKKDGFSELKNLFINNFTDYLTVLGGAYKRVANDSNPTARISEMLRLELEKPESNHNIPVRTLYSDFAQILIKKCTGNRFVGWLFKKLIGKEEVIIRGLISQGIGSLKDTNGYTHALNSVIVEELEDILALMQENEARAAETGNSALNDSLSEHKKLELTGLVENLFRILRKHKCQTQDQLKSTVDGTSIEGNIIQAVDGLFLEDVIENVTKIIAIAIGSVLKEDQLQKITYKFVSLVNSIYEKGEEFTDEQIRDTERKLGHLTDRILNLAIKTAVEEKLDFSGRKEQKETNKAILAIKQNTETFVEETRGSLEALSTVDLESDEASVKMDMILNKMLTYQTDSSNAASTIRGNADLNPDNKQEIEILYAGLAKTSLPLVQSLTTMKQALQEVDNFRKLAPELRGIENTARSIQEKLCKERINSPDIELCREMIAVLEHHLQIAKQFPHLKTLTDQLSSKITTLATALNEFQNLIRTFTFCANQMGETSLAAQIAKEKAAAFGTLLPSISLSQKIKALKEAIIGLNDESSARSLLAILEKVKNSCSQAELDEYIAEYKQAALALFNNSRAKIAAAKTQIAQAVDQTCGLITGSNQLDGSSVERSKQSAQESLRQSQEHLERLSQWDHQSVKPINYVNIEVADMQSFQGIATGLVFKRVKERVDGLVTFLRDPTTYQYGFAHHLALIPMVEAQRANRFI